MAAAMGCVCSAVLMFFVLNLSFCDAYKSTREQQNLRLIKEYVTKLVQL